MINLNIELTQEQIELLENNEWGIRGKDKVYEQEYIIGEFIDEEYYSKEWSDDPDYPGEEYDGVCAVEPDTYLDTLEEQIAEALEYQEKNYKYDEYYLVVAMRDTQMGTDDQREIILNNPLVVARIK